MKTFLKENWYKLMIGTSMMMASFGFMVYAISPAYSNSELEKSEMNNEVNLNAPVGTNVARFADQTHFVDGGYYYICKTAHLNIFLGMSTLDDFGWVGNNFGYIENGKIPPSVWIGGKYKLH